jgi:hypothetical protein
LLQFLKPSLYLMVVHPGKADFKQSAQLQLARASAFVLREQLPDAVHGGETKPAWTGVSLPWLHAKPPFLQREGEPLPSGLAQTVREMLAAAPGIRF